MCIRSTAMQLLLIAAIVAVVALLSARSLWDRFKGDADYGIEPWMLRVVELGGVCRDYLDLIGEVRSGRHDRETIHYLDGQRQVTHNQILGYLDLDRSSAWMSRRSRGATWSRRSGC